MHIRDLVISLLRTPLNVLNEIKVLSWKWFVKIIFLPEEWTSSDNPPGGNTKPQSETAVGVAYGSRASVIQEAGHRQLWSDAWGLFCFQKPQCKQSTETEPLIISINTQSYCNFSTSVTQTNVYLYCKHTYNFENLYGGSTACIFNEFFCKAQDIKMYFTFFFCCCSLER